VYICKQGGHILIELDIYLVPTWPSIKPTDKPRTFPLDTGVASNMLQKKGMVGKNTIQQDGSAYEVAELKSLVKWEKSDGKKMLKVELWNVNSRFRSMNIKDIHSSDVHFSVYPLKNFTTNVNNLKKKVDGLRAQVDFDNQAVSQHKKSYPWLPNTKEDIHTGMVIQQNNILKMMSTMGLWIQCFQANWGWLIGRTKTFRQKFSVSQCMLRSGSRGSKPFGLQSKTKLQWSSI